MTYLFIIIITDTQAIIHHIDKKKKNTAEFADYVRTFINVYP